jgi:hypothetical protein
MTYGQGTEDRGKATQLTTREEPKKKNGLKKSGEERGTKKCKGRCSTVKIKQPTKMTCMCMHLSAAANK